VELSTTLFALDKKTVTPVYKIFKETWIKKTQLMLSTKAFLLVHF
jgi:hypothetical protein